MNCSYNSGPNYWDTLVTCVAPGTSYKVTQSNLYVPPGDGNAYHPWPVFDTRFQYNNGDIPEAEKALRLSVSSLICQGTGLPCWVDTRVYNPSLDADNSGGDSLLFEVRIRPQNTKISRRNGFTMAIGVLLNPLPNFRVWSSGTSTAKLNPDDLNGSIAARCAVERGGAGTTRIGDNCRYFAVFDYVKTTSRVRSPWVRVFPSTTIDPDYFPLILDPPLSLQPIGTQVSFEFEGATTIKGTNGTGFSPDVNVADLHPNVAFRATLVGSTTTLLLPTFDTIAIPFLRPFGK
jgi:hypothetical protein